MMPIDYRDYPSDWNQRRKRVLARSAGRGKHPACEKCGVPQYAVGYRVDEGRFVPNAGNGPCDGSGRGQRWPGGGMLTYSEAREFADHYNSYGDGTDDDGNRWIVIVLTVAHLDEGGPLDCPDDRLAALCQRCHLRLDAKMHGRNAAATKRARKAVADLFPAG